MLIEDKETRTGQTSRAGLQFRNQSSNRRDVRQAGSAAGTRKRVARSRRRWAGDRGAVLEAVEMFTRLMHHASAGRR